MIRNLRQLLFAGARTVTSERFAPVALAMVGLGLAILSGAHQLRQTEYEDLGEAILSRRAELAELATPAAELATHTPEFDIP